jgi:uncharacterized protein
MKTQRIVIAGGSGFLGQALALHFRILGWQVVVLTRSPRATVEMLWDGRTVGPWAAQLEGADAVVNLAGRSVDCRYTAANRRILIDSRVQPTVALGEAIAGCATPPRVWLNASSATLYRHTMDRAWDETGVDFTPTAAVRDAFSVQIIREWEQALNEALTPRTRKLALRTTMVLGEGRNSVFPVLRRMARMGLGGTMGSGRQFVSWLHVADFCRAVEWLITHDEVSGPVNLAAPNPVTNAELMRAFRDLVGMPIGLPAAGWMLEVGAFFMRTETELILKSRRVAPGKLLAGGFTFDHPTLRDALAHLHHR